MIWSKQNILVVSTCHVVCDIKVFTRSFFFPAYWQNLILKMLWWFYERPTEIFLLTSVFKIFGVVEYSLGMCSNLERERIYGNNACITELFLTTNNIDKTCKHTLVFHKYKNTWFTIWSADESGWTSSGLMRVQILK